MKKSEVIDMLEDVVVLLKGDGSCDDLISAVRYAIAVIQGGTADKPREWIPCSERLPEKEGRYLCTNDELGGWITSINIWLGDHWLYPNKKPIAWMPLPSAYKGEKDD